MNIAPLNIANFFILKVKRFKYISFAEINFIGSKAYFELYKCLKTIFLKSWAWEESNLRPFRCKRNVITTRPQALNLDIQQGLKSLFFYFKNGERREEREFDRGS